MTDDLISKKAAIDALGEEPEVWSENDEYALGLNNQWHYDVSAIKAVPSAQPDHLREPTKMIERKTGWWEAKEVADNDSKIITQWQSCKCSECGRYDTRPYLYYFNEPNFCSFCGAAMTEGEQDGR